jgi:hypothetical protein
MLSTIVLENDKILNLCSIKENDKESIGMDVLYFLKLDCDLRLLHNAYNIGANVVF